MIIFRNNQKLQDGLELLQQQQKELSARQSIYNQQQLDFITRKNALSAQQFDFADKLSSYNAQVKLYNENLEKFEAEKLAFQEKETLFETRVLALEQEKADFEAQKNRFEQDKTADEVMRKDMQTRAQEEQEALQRKIGELQEKELELSQRENSLNAKARDLQNRQYTNAYQQSAFAYSQPSPVSPITPTQTEQQADLRERAQAEGIKLNIAGNMHAGNYAEVKETKNSSGGIYNVGRTLYKTAFIIFCIIAFESLLVFFLKDILGVSVAYPAVGFGAGFILFITCAIMNACSFRPRARRKKHAPYLLTAAVILVICIIITTMIAVYCKAEISNPAQMLSFIVFPIVYLMNILFFAIFYRLLSTKESKERN